MWNPLVIDLVWGFAFVYWVHCPVPSISRLEPGSGWTWYYPRGTFSLFLFGESDWNLQWHCWFGLSDSGLAFQLAGQLVSGCTFGPGRPVELHQWSSTCPRVNCTHSPLSLLPPTFLRWFSSSSTLGCGQQIPVKIDVQCDRVAPYMWILTTMVGFRRILSEQDVANVSKDVVRWFTCCE